MKTVLVNLKNLIPYLFLISIYFIFINIEAKKAQRTEYIKSIEKKTKIKDKYSSDNKIDLRIEIPVVPYNQ